MVQPTSGAIRAANRASIVQVLRREGWATRAQLVEQTRLSRATVSSVLGDLAARGLLSERREGGTTQGRPAAVVGLNRSAGIAIAVDVGVRHVAVAVGDLSRSVLAERWTTLPRGHRAAQGTRIVLRSIADSLEQAGVDPEQLVGAAISIAAPVAGDSGDLLVPDVLPGWNGPSLAEKVAERWSIPVAIDNDANLGALGEAASTRPDDGGLLYVKVASRIGMGFVLDKHIVRGRDGYAGELGHVTVRAGGEACWCGRRGCLELYAGADGMLRRLSTNAAALSVADLLELVGTDARVRRVVDDGARALAAAIANAALLLNPGRVVIGGELAALGEILLEPVRRELDSIPFGRPVPLSSASLGERASLIGALSLVLTESTHFVDRCAQGAPRAPAPGRDEPPARPPLTISIPAAHPRRQGAPQ